MAWRLLHRHPMLVLAVLLVVGVGVVFYNNHRAAQRLVESKALLDAEIFSQAVAEVRTLYTSEVVETVQREGIEVRHDYSGHRGAIPLPVTFSMLLGEALGKRQAGHATELYSPYPFPWRKYAGLRDDFARTAWQALSRDGARPYYRFETMGGVPVLRYATADRMRPSCLTCHNTHLDTPKNDWKEGDLRGVLEVRLPMQRIQEQTRAELQSSFLLMSLAGGLGFGLLALVVSRLRRTSDELEGALEKLRQNHDSLRVAHDDLVLARDQAQASARLQNQFLGNMSHELRTPLNAILGYTELVFDELEERGNSEHTELLDKVRDASRSLLELIDQVLDVSRLEAGTMELESRDFDVKEMVSALVSSLGDMTRAGALGFEVLCEQDVGSLHADERKVRKLLEKLLDNARRFTEKGAITLRVRRESELGRAWVVFEVEDTGIGIREADLENLFEPFSQADSSITRRFQGMGLGLTLAKGLAERMGGSIAVQSEPGKGSTFSVRLPVNGASAEL